MDASSFKRVSFIAAHEQRCAVPLLPPLSPPHTLPKLTQHQQQTPPLPPLTFQKLPRRPSAPAPVQRRQKRKPQQGTGAWRGRTPSSGRSWDTSCGRLRCRKCVVQLLPRWSLCCSLRRSCKAGFELVSGKVCPVVPITCKYARARWISGVCRPSIDGSVHPKNFVKLFEQLLVREKSNDDFLSVLLWFCNEGRNGDFCATVFVSRFCDTRCTVCYVVVAAMIVMLLTAPCLQGQLQGSVMQAVPLRVC
jgi:hypothetical protein